MPALHPPLCRAATRPTLHASPTCCPPTRRRAPCQSLPPCPRCSYPGTARVSRLHCTSPTGAAAEGLPAGSGDHRGWDSQHLGCCEASTLTWCVRLPACAACALAATPTAAFRGLLRRPSAMQEHRRRCARGVCRLQHLYQCPVEAAGPRPRDRCTPDNGPSRAGGGQVWLLFFPPLARHTALSCLLLGQRSAAGA